MVRRDVTFTLSVLNEDCGNSVSEAEGKVRNIEATLVTLKRYALADVR